MKEKYTLANMPKGRTNWAKVRAKTEEEIEAAANSDPDVPLLTQAELKKMKRVHSSAVRRALSKD